MVFFDIGYTMAHCDQTLVVTAWVPLVDANVENGCMYVLPWAFDNGILPHKTGENDHADPFIPCDNILCCAAYSACVLLVSGVP